MAGLPRPSEPSKLLEIDDDLRGRFLDPDQHVEVLAPMSVRHRRRGNPRSAFAFADRYCRLTHHRDAFGLLLRAEASEELGDADGYRVDVEASFKADPMLAGAARRMLAMAPSAARADIARLILSNPRADREARLDAIEAVLALKYDIVCELRFDGRDIQGFLAWEATEWIEFSFDPDSAASWSRIPREMLHQRGRRELAIAHLPLQPVRDPDDASAKMLAFRARTERGGLRRFDTNRSSVLRPIPRSAKRQVAVSRGEVQAEITVIVPVFGHRRMTQLCLIALLRQKREMPGLRVLIVDDNPERSVLTPAMVRAADAAGFEIVRNHRNIGFARSVNRAFAMTDSGDVLLLNADVLLPPGAIGRLAAASRRTSDIGTVTPFSNDGEEASFPTPLRRALLLPFRQVCALDRTAAAANGSNVVTIVNGVGFCLYITRQALDAVGSLPTVYERGYYEDVDFALAVREAGLRNVCATGVYVGHKGSGSFQEAKQALVARNRRILFSRYPSYVSESAALVAADPLRPARAAIERALVPSEPIKVLLVLPAHAIAKVMVYRKATGSARCLILTWPQDRTDKLIIWMSDGSAPQSLLLEGAGALASLKDYLRVIGVETAHIVASAFEGRDLIQHLRDGGITIEMLFDDSLLRFQAQRDESKCDVAAGNGPCEACIDGFSKASVRGKAGAAALKVARRIHPMNAMARAVAQHFRLETGEPRKAASGIPVLKACKATTLGILAPAGDVEVERLLLAIARHALPPRAEMVVLGPCLDVTPLMSAGVVVSGPVAEEELERLFTAYGVDILLAPSRWGGYGELERHRGSRPTAFFDWSGGLLRKHPHDLALDPRACDRKIAHQVDAWWRGLRSSDD